MDKKPTPRPAPVPPPAPLEENPGAPDWMLWVATVCIIVGVVIVLAMLAGCAPIDGGPAATVEPATVQSLPVPAWAAYPVGQWLNMDWDLWSCPRARGC